MLDLEVGVLHFESTPPKDRIHYLDFPASSIATYLLDNISNFQDPVLLSRDNLLRGIVGVVMVGVALFAVKLFLAWL